MNTPYYTKAENDAIEANLRRQYNYGASEYRGFLAIADTPTLDGWYWATEIGTYTNAGGLVTVADTINMIEKNGSTYNLSDVAVPLTSVVDNLTSTSASNALSANQGRLLNEKFEDYQPLTNEVVTSFPLNTAYNSPSFPTINLISSELFPKGTITQVKINAENAGIMKFAFFRKLTNAPTYRILKYFNVRVNAGVNTIKVNEFINEDFYFGAVDCETVFYTAGGNVGDPVNLHYSVGSFDDSTVFAIETGRGTNIEIEVTQGLNAPIETGKSLCLIGDSITDFCNSPASNGKQYMGYDYFIQQKIKFNPENRKTHVLFVRALSSIDVPSVHRCQGSNHHHRHASE